jgi:hypothetical protein
MEMDFETEGKKKGDKDIITSGNTEVMVKENT